MGEFELIDAIVAQLGRASTGPAVVVGPGDDAAVVTLPPAHELVTSVDTLVADLHFPAGADPELIAQRALRVSVSDLAAMGARPLAAVVALVLPTTTTPEWVRSLSHGFSVVAEQLACPITGGNLTAGELSVSVTVQGSVPAGTAILRSGARAGDEVWVSGPLGGAAVALTTGGLALVKASDAAYTDAVRAYFLPEPQVELGIALRGLASSAIDISDGLAADLGHIAASSGVAVQLDSAAISRRAGASLAQALHGGDDYQLCFTAPPQQAAAITARAPAARVIGRCVELTALAPGVTAASQDLAAARDVQRLYLDGAPLAARGFDHFNAVGASAHD